jgi:hypothetical protein
MNNGACEALVSLSFHQFLIINYELIVHRLLLAVEHLTLPV